MAKLALDSGYGSCNITNHWGVRGVASVLTWNNLGFKDGGYMRVISLDRVENAVVPIGALKDIPRSKRRHGSG